MVQSSEARNPSPESEPSRASWANPNFQVHPGNVSKFVRRIVSPIDRGRFKRALMIAIGLPFLLMAVTAGTLIWSVRELVAANAAVQQASETVTQSFEALTLILDMETGIRGFVNTGAREFLQPYEAALPKVGPALRRVESLADSREEERGQVKSIERLLAQWQSFADDAIQKRSSGAAASARIDSAQGKALIDSIRQNFAWLVAEERERRDAAQLSARRAGRIASRLGLLVSLAVAAILALLVGYEILAISRTYEEALDEADTLSQELSRRESHFRLLAEAIPQMVWSTSADGTPEYFNQRWRDYIGVPRLSREPWIDRVHIDDQPSARSAWQNSLSSGNAFSCEVRLRDASDSFRWHLGRALPLRNQQREILRWLGTFTDIADQKKAEEAIARLAAIVETSQDAIYANDLSGHITSWNRGAEKMHGYSPDEMIGQHISRLTPAERRRETQDILELLKRGESIEHIETVRLRKDGTQVEVSLAISPIRNSVGAITGASTIARDVTERNRAAEALRKTEKLAATGRLAGTMAHEINNPLEAVTHLLYLIDKSPSLDTGAREYTRIAMDEIARIGHIAKHALGFYREASAPVDVNISQLVRDVMELYASGAQNKNVSIETQLETNATISAYPGEMRQIFSNLIVNAVDAVARGGTVKIRVKHGRNWRSRALGIRVLVSDNGPGIPKLVRPRIFEPFFTTKGERGTGVGLWVSEGVVHKQGGTIQVRSSTNAMHGTTFAVFIPYG